MDDAPGPEADAVASLEESVLAANGVVLRYGMFHGPGTYFEKGLPPEPRVHIDAAAARTVEALGAAFGHPDHRRQLIDPPNPAESDLTP